MASFNKTVASKSVIPTAIDGIYVKDLTIAELKAMQDKLAVITNEDDITEPVLVLFQDVIRAEDGTVFEDMQDAESLLDNLTFNLMMDISEAVSVVLNRGSSLKK